MSFCYHVDDFPFPFLSYTGVKLYVQKISFSRRFNNPTKSLFFFY
uniref:Uncharacterized protein n=1 Tax=Rhizophora mucronata TaxID=61149 RepID=A0A2P2PLY8_RHIMU